MDKYEYKLMAEEIVRLVGKKQYKAAASIADEIRWEKVKNVQMLCTVSEVYEKIGQYEESRDVLLLAYNRSANGKMIVYRLVNLCIALKDYQEATDFYHEYMQMSPNDPSILILKYKLYKARNAKLETLISILEDFKEQDYQEEWILELARLYHQAGDSARCVELCDEIDLWFNKGACVIQALELKRLYEPLTVLQENKLFNREEFLNDKPKVTNREVKKEKKVEREPRRGQKPASGSEKEIVREPKKAVRQEMPREAKRPVRRDVQTGSSKVAPVDLSDPLAEALIKLARGEEPKEPKEKALKKGFSILPKDETSAATELDLGAVENIKDVERREFFQQNTDESEQSRDLEKTKRWDKDSIENLDVENPEFEELDEPEQFTEMESEDEPEQLGAREALDDSEEQEDTRGIFGRMFSKLRMEDDELDDDFNDDYMEDDFLDEKEKSMVTRGLTGQYEKVELDEDDLDEENIYAEEDEDYQDAYGDEDDDEEYEYIYGDEDDDDEYDDVDDYEDVDEYDDVEDYEEADGYDNEYEYEDMDEEAFAAAYQDEFADEVVDESQMTQEELMQAYVSKYDTLNLQKELAKSIQQLMDATEKETVDSTLENVKRMVERSNIPELTETMRFKAIRGNMLNKVAKKQAEKLQDGRDIEEVVSENAAIAEAEPSEDSTVSFAETRPKPVAEFAIKLKPVEEEEVPMDRILTQENDGQISMIIPEETEEEEQIEGQLNLQDVLREWEKQELLSENDKEKRALEEARKRALEETQEIMSEIMGLLKDVIPKIGSIKDGEEKMSILAESLERVQKSLPLSQGIIEAAEESKEAASAIEAACEEAVMALEQLENAKEDDVVEDIEEAILAALPEETEALAEEVEASAEDELAEEETVAEEPVADETEPEVEAPTVEEPVADETEPEVEAPAVEESVMEENDPTSNIDEQMALYSVMQEEPVQDNEQLLNEVTEAEWEKFKESFMEQVIEERQKQEEAEKALEAQKAVEAQIAATREAKQNQYEQFKMEDEESLNEEQKEVLSYFLSIKGIAPMLERVVKQTERAPEHMIVTGEDGCGKTSIAMRIIKAAQVNKTNKVETIAKIQAPLLNQKDIYGIFERVNGGVLIIERAGDLSQDTINKIVQAFYTNKYHVQLVFVDKKKYMDELLQQSDSFINDIQMRLDLPVYTNHELAEFSKTYAAINGYTFDGMALLALYSLIELFQSDQHIASLEDMKNIMNEAMERADKRNNKLLGKLFGRKKTDEKVLLESDFE